MTKKIYLVLAISFLAIPLLASAATMRGGQDYTLGKNDVADKNLYALGNNINILGQAQQDVAAFGGSIVISGNIAKDLAAAGGNLMIDGNIGEDARLGGGNLNIGGKIGGELMAAGGQLNLNSGLEVSGNTVLAGGNILIDGNFSGDVSAYGGTVRIDGKIAGNVKVRANEKLVIGNNAEIAGNLDYSSAQQLILEDGAKIQGQVTFNELKKVPEAEKVQKAKKGLFGLWGIGWLIGWAISLTAALVVLFLLRKKVEQAVSYVLANFGKETLRGFIILVVLPVAVLISCITVIGLLLGGTGILLYILMAVFASIFAPIVLGSWIFRLILKKPDFGADWKSVVVGVVALKIVQLIPFVGWIFCFIFFLAAFGMLFNYLYRHFRKA